MAPVARNAEEIGSLLPQSGFVMLCGGHVPTQNHFFAQLGLPGLFHNYHGIVLGVSAGSMNAARLVYAAYPGDVDEFSLIKMEKFLRLRLRPAPRRSRAKPPTPATAAG